MDTAKQKHASAEPRHPAAPEPVAGPHRTLGRVTRVLARLGGANPERLRSCPADDLMAAVRSGLALASSYLFIAGALLLGLTVALGGGRSDLWILCASAALIAIIISLVDHSMIQTSWGAAGATHLRTLQRAIGATGAAGDRNLKASARVSRFISAIVLGIFRLGLSLTLAFTLSTLLELVVFERDIVRRVEVARAAHNAPIIRDAEERVAGQISRLEARVRVLSEAHAAAQAEELRLSSQLSDLDHRDGQRRAEMRMGLEQQRATALEEAQRRRAEAIAERQGIRETSRNSGVAGEGARFRNAMSQAEALVQRADELMAEIVRLDQAGTAVAAARARLDAQRHRLTDLVSREAAARAELDLAVAERASRIRTMAQSSESYAVVRDGLLLRIDTLEAMKAESPALALFAMALKALLMLCEMGGLVTKLLASGASVYAVKTAAEVEIGSFQATLDADAAIARALATREEAQSEQEREAQARARTRAADAAAERARAHFDALLKDAVEAGEKSRRDAAAC